MPPEPRMGALVGTVLGGGYRITGLIGKGGMGAVYEAVQLRLNKRVAVKLMARDLAANREALARFHREAEITSRLGHPHLVNVMDFSQAESGAPVGAAKSPATESFDVDKFLREHDQRTKRKQDPWADGSDVSPGIKQPKKPASPSETKPPAARKPPPANSPLIEEL